MATQNFNLIPSRWQDLGPTPLSIRTMSSPDAVLCVSPDTPKTLGAPYSVLSAREGSRSIRVPGYHVYGRSMSGSVMVSVDPDVGSDTGSGGGGGGGPTIIGDGDDVTQGNRADSAVVDPDASASAVALLKGLVTLIKSLTDEVATLNALNAPFQGAVAVTVNVPFTAGRALKVDCSAAGKVTVMFADGSTDVLPVVVGLNILPGAFTKVLSDGTTAVGSYSVYR